MWFKWRSGCCPENRLWTDLYHCISVSLSRSLFLWLVPFLSNSVPSTSLLEYTVFQICICLLALNMNLDQKAILKPITSVLCVWVVKKKTNWTVKTEISLLVKHICVNGLSKGSMYSVVISKQTTFCMILIFIFCSYMKKYVCFALCLISILWRQCLTMQRQLMLFMS